MATRHAWPQAHRAPGCRPLSLSALSAAFLVPQVLHLARFESFAKRIKDRHMAEVKRLRGEGSDSEFVVKTLEHGLHVSQTCHVHGGAAQQCLTLFVVSEWHYKHGPGHAACTPLSIGPPPVCVCVRLRLTLKCGADGGAGWRTDLQLLRAARCAHPGGGPPRPQSSPRHVRGWAPGHGRQRYAQDRLHGRAATPSTHDPRPLPRRAPRTHPLAPLSALSESDRIGARVLERSRRGREVYLSSIPSHPIPPVFFSWRRGSLRGERALRGVDL